MFQIMTLVMMIINTFPLKLHVEYVYFANFTV